MEKQLALISQHFYPEMVSTGMHMTELGHRLREKGWQITAYCAQPAYTGEEGEEELDSEIVHQGIRIKRVPTSGEYHESLSSRLLFSITYLLSTIYALLRDRDKYDGMLVTTNPPFIGLAGWVISGLCEKPYIQLVYDVYPDSAVQLGVVSEKGLPARLWERGTRLMLNGAAATVVIGRDMAEIINEKLARENWGDMHLIPNWSDERTVEPISREENPFRQEHGIGSQYLVQYAGRLARTYDLGPLVEAADYLEDQPIIFQFIGEGKRKEELQQKVRELDLDNVMFLPYQPRDELNSVLSAADLAVVCLGSRFTGLCVPSKTYGIMASKTPILGFLDEESEVGRTVRENDCGVILEEPSGREVACTISELIEEPERLQGMGERGRRAFEENFTLSAAAERYDKVLNRYIYGIGTSTPVPTG